MIDDPEYERLTANLIRAGVRLAEARAAYIKIITDVAYLNFVEACRVSVTAHEALTAYEKSIGANPSPTL